MRIIAILAILIIMASCNSPRLVKAPLYSPDLCKVGKTYVRGPNSVIDDYSAVVAYIGKSDFADAFIAKFNELVDYRSTGWVTQVEYQLENGVVMVASYQSLSYCREVYSKMISELNIDGPFGEVYFISIRKPFKSNE